MDTQHEATATIVTAAQGPLVEELRHQGVRVAAAEVTCTPGETGRHSQGPGRRSAPDPDNPTHTPTQPADPLDHTPAAPRPARPPRPHPIDHGPCTEGLPNV